MKNSSRRRSIALGMAVLVLFVAAAAALIRQHRQTAQAEIKGSLPKLLEKQFEYAGSESCRSCHADQFASWHDSYHRSMTQPATPQSVQAPFDDITLKRFGWDYRLERRGDQFWIDMVDPDWERQQFARGNLKEYYIEDPPRVRKPIVMVTGSHHKQAFWVESSTRDFYCRIPWSYRIDDRRWIPLEHDYLAPPDAGPSLGIWNDNCIQCHTVAGQPRRQEIAPGNEDSTQDVTPFDFESRVAELGIACEACHGPGAGHVALHRSSAEGPRSSQSQPPKPTLADRIVNPAKLSHDRAAQVCGQCHVASVIKDYPHFLRFGFPYRPGDDLNQTMYFMRYRKQPREPWLAQVVKQDPSLLENRFWKDGAVRVTGREFNGLLESPCFQRGEMSCLSCHSMHGYQDRSDQLGPNMETNAACTQCHQKYEGRWEEHTHHQPGSSGDQCVNCHMPHTTYGLFKAIHSHRIDSPNAATSLKTGRPNACNLCHLDRTQYWTASHLSKWYGQEQVALSEEERTIAASVLWLLRGDAAQRAIIAWHIGWEPAQQASGAAWLPPYLAILMKDPYSAVRNVAGRSLVRLKGFEDISYDFLASDAERARSAQQVLSRMSKLQSLSDVEKASNSFKEVLLTEDGKLRQDKIDQLLEQRDHRRVYIAE